MRAVIIEGAGGVEVLSVREVPRPVPKGREILVRVHGSALNRADILQRQGRYPPPAGAPVNIPGLEYAGEVAANGARATRFREGDRVFGIVAGGAHAEYLVTDERACATVPPDLQWMDAAAIPEVFITAHDALVTQAGLRRRERLIITAVGSGVGLAAAQLAAAMDCDAFGITRTADKLERSREYGISGGITLAEPTDALTAAVSEWSGGASVNVALDLVAGPWTEALLATLALKGRLMLVGTLAGARATLTLGVILRQRLTVRGTMLRSRSLTEKIAATRVFARDVVPLLERGALRAVTDSVYPLDQVREAHARMEGNETFGKVVLRVT
jgi:NADPH:quinone reductase-like Zn-dependent oxidoreductase